MAGQAFHWFEPHEARREFQRALKIGGFIALIWNMWRKGEPFADAHAALQRQGSVDFL